MEEQMKVYTPEKVFKYAYYGNVDNLRLALDYGNNSIHWYRTERGHTALFAAAWQGHIECIGVLLDKGADIESKINLGDAALHAAACQGHTACIGVLLDRGADIECTNSDGSTALHRAAEEGHSECIVALLDRGADIESNESDGSTALPANRLIEKTIRDDH